MGIRETPARGFDFSATVVDWTIWTLGNPFQQKNWMRS